MSSNKPMKDFILMVLHWVLVLVICFASVFIQYLFVSNSRSSVGKAVNEGQLYKINYIVYIIGVVIGVIGFVGLWIALLHKDWMKLGGINVKWRIACVIAQITAAVFSLVLSGIAIVFSASFGEVKWYDIIYDPATLCIISYFMFASMIIIFLLYEEIARPFSKGKKSEEE
ncbi:hypothetical protein SAMN04487934_11741 [Eubacterium ruminantium]|nr:hypothetical protein SAMN04487934_11741 [Eubacterium ruminantium]